MEQLRSLVDYFSGITPTESQLLRDIITYLTEQVGEIFGSFDFSDTFTATTFASLDHHRKADFLS